MMLEPNPGAYRWRQDTPLDDWPDYHKTLFQHLGFETLLKGISAVKDKQLSPALAMTTRSQSDLRGSSHSNNLTSAGLNSHPFPRGSHKALSHLEHPNVVLKFADDTTAVVVSYGTMMRPTKEGRYNTWHERCSNNNLFLKPATPRRSLGITGGRGKQLSCAWTTVGCQRHICSDLVCC